MIAEYCWALDENDDLFINWLVLLNLALNCLDLVKNALDLFNNLDKNNDDC